MSTKIFDSGEVEAVQIRCAELRAAMRNCIYVHSNSGARYLVTEVAVDEGSGVLRVSYCSIDPMMPRPYSWTRTYDEFVEEVVSNAPPYGLVLRFVKEK